MQCSSRTARLPRPHRDVTDRDAHLADHLSRDLAGIRADRPSSDKTVPFDHNEAFGPMKPANLVIIADHFTERAGDRPHTDVRLANRLDPCPVKPRLRGTVSRHVENPVTDLGSDSAPVSHGCSRSRIWMSFLTRRTPVSAMSLSFAVALTPSGTVPPRVRAPLAMAAIPTVTSNCFSHPPVHLPRLPLGKRHLLSRHRRP